MQAILFAVGLVVLAVAFLAMPLAWRWPVIGLAAILTSAFVVHWYRFVRRKRERRRADPPSMPPDPDAPLASEPDAAESPRIERYEESGVQVTRVSFPLATAVPMVLRARRRQQPRTPELLVRNTGIEQSAFEFELLPILSGDDEFDQLVEMRSNQRLFVQSFLRHDHYDRFVEMFQSERWVLLELHCDGEKVHFVLHPPLDELPLASANAFLQHAEMFHAAIEDAIGEQLERFFPSA
ncbi:MAG: hypothetical protein KC609_26930 [Myxococcales bacterium]|nr:hypothetical protein [Myxococcales bacterium]